MMAVLQDAPKEGVATTRETWRERLQRQVEGIQRAGGPPPEGNRIVVQAELDDSRFRRFLGSVGRVNDLPFCGADPGRLEIGPLSRWEDGSVQLTFILRSAPPPDFGSSRGLTHPRAEGQPPRRLIPGIGFESLP